MAATPKQRMQAPPSPPPMYMEGVVMETQFMTTPGSMPMPIPMQSGYLAPQSQLVQPSPTQPWQSTQFVTQGPVPMSMPIPMPRQSGYLAPQSQLVQPSPTQPRQSTQFVTQGPVPMSMPIPMPRQSGYLAPQSQGYQAEQFMQPAPQVQAHQVPQYMQPMPPTPMTPQMPTQRPSHANTTYRPAPSTREMPMYATTDDVGGGQPSSAQMRATHREATLILNNPDIGGSSTTDQDQAGSYIAPPKGNINTRISKQKEKVEQLSRAAGNGNDTLEDAVEGCEPGDCSCMSAGRVAALTASLALACFMSAIVTDKWLQIEGGSIRGSKCGAGNTTDVVFGAVRYCSRPEYSAADVQISNNAQPGGHFCRFYADDSGSSYLPSAIDMSNHECHRFATIGLCDTITAGGVAVWIAVAFSYIAALFSEIPRIVLCCNMVSACAGFSAVAMWDALRTDAEEHVDGYSTHGDSFATLVSASALALLTVLLTAYELTVTTRSCCEVNDDAQKAKKTAKKELKNLMKEKAGQTSDWKTWLRTDVYIWLVQELRWGRFGSILGQLAWIASLVSAMDSEWATTDTLGQEMGGFRLDLANRTVLGPQEFCAQGLPVLGAAAPPTFPPTRRPGRIPTHSPTHGAPETRIICNPAENAANWDDERCRLDAARHAVGFHGDGRDHVDPKAGYCSTPEMSSSCGGYCCVTRSPTVAPTTFEPSAAPSAAPTATPMHSTTMSPTMMPTTMVPTYVPSPMPTMDADDCKADVDFMFLQDESSSITPAKWQAGTEFIGMMSDKFTVGRRCVPIPEDVTEDDRARYPVCSDTTGLSGDADCGTQPCFRAGGWKSRVGLATFSGKSPGDQFGCAGENGHEGAAPVLPTHLQARANASNGAVLRFSMSAHVDSSSLDSDIDDLANSQRCGRTHTKEGIVLLQETLETLDDDDRGDGVGDNCNWRRVKDGAHGLCAGPHQNGTNCWFRIDNFDIDHPNVLRQGGGRPDVTVVGRDGPDGYIWQIRNIDGRNTTADVVRLFAVVITDGVPNPRGEQRPKDAYEVLRQTCPQVEVIPMGPLAAATMFGPAFADNRWMMVDTVNPTTDIASFEEDLKKRLCPDPPTPTPPAPTREAFCDFNDFQFDEDTYKCFAYDDELGPQSNRVEACSVFGKNTSDGTETCDLCGTTNSVHGLQVAAVVVGLLADWYSDDMLFNSIMQLLGTVLCWVAVGYLGSVTADESCFGQDVSSLYGRSFWLLAFSGASFFCGGVSCGIDRHIHGPSNPIHLDARTLKKLNEAGKCPASKTWVILERGTGICSSCGQSFSAKCGRRCMAGCHFLCSTCYQRALSRPTVVLVQMFISYVSPGRQQPSGQFRKGARAPRK